MDAGQAFEALNPKTIELALQDLFTRAERSPVYPSLQILNSGRSVVAAGSSPHARYEDKRVVLLTTLKKILYQFLQVRSFRLESSALRQRSGGPIGGTLSSAILDAALMFLDFDTSRPWHARYVATARYADALLGASRQFCLGCLKSFLRGGYNKSIAFDNGEDLAVFQDCSLLKFLDGIIIFNWTCIEF